MMNASSSSAMKLFTTHKSIHIRKFKHYLVVSSRVGVISSSDVSTLVLRNVPAEEYTAQSNVSFLFEHWFLHYHQIIRLTFRK